MIEDFIIKHNLPRFRKNQFDIQYYNNAISSFDELTDWPKDLRDSINKEVEFSSITPNKVFGGTSNDTMKVLFQKTSDKKLFESVLLRHKDGRNTVCVSCMVGCPVGCKFCATGKMGFLSNLKAREIIDQVLFFQRELKIIGSKVTNVVFMGMGEPLLNLKEVWAAIEVLTNPDKLALSIRRITISTCGIINGIKELIQLDFKGRLAISLHAPVQGLREELIPMARTNKLPDLMKVLDEYVEVTNQRVSYEYILLNGVNDSKKYAEELAVLLSGRLAHVNIIRYNIVSEGDFARSDQENVNHFCAVLKKLKLNYTVRVSLGSEIEGACGQLTTKNTINI
jgi:23S rRNA (adenine(2503)-C(2))-methyltransferase